MRSFLIRTSVLSGTILVVCLLFLTFVYHSTQTEPSFYREALTVDVAAQEAAGQELEIQACELHNQIVSQQSWEATFTDEQINGWLATDLPKKFPETLPSSVSEPRMQVGQGMVKLACWYRSSRFQGVITLECEPFLTDAPNELALRVCRLQTGLVPLPLNQWLDEVSREAAKVGYPLRWSQEGGDPVALIQLPVDEILDDHVLTVDRLAIEDGKLQISGTSRPVEGESDSKTQLAEKVSQGNDQASHQ